MDKENWLDQFNHLNEISSCVHEQNGLSFNNPKLSTKYIQLNPTLTNENIIYYNQINESNYNNNILLDVGKDVILDMAKSKREPIKIQCIHLPNLHNELVKNIGQETGIMDMWIKPTKSYDIILPIELEPIIPIIDEIYKYESTINKNIYEWNMWLLVDTRTVKKNHPQRNGGYHYDGLSISGNHKGKPITSNISWCNTLPTRFYIGNINFPPNFKSNYNANIIAQKQIKKQKYILDSYPNIIYKFDGATVHTGIDSNDYINDRVFIRVCFTSSDVLFNRIGNTINPALVGINSDIYNNFGWKNINHPFIIFKNILNYNNCEEFKNLWDIACLGHPCASIKYMGKKSIEYKLILSIIKTTKQFINGVCKLYDDENTLIGEIRKQLLIKKIDYFII